MGTVREYAGKAPILGERVYLAETAAVIGDVVLGDDVSVWYNSVVRGDCHFIRVGARTNIQDNCAVHVTQEKYPTILEEEVTLGHGAIVHGAVVRRGALIGIRATVLEESEVFARSVGETTDLVHKEMYTFPDRKGRSLTMRPENTAGVVRAVIENGLAGGPMPLRLYYIGPQFRYERPQAGRFREF